MYQGINYNLPQPASNLKQGGALVLAGKVSKPKGKASKPAAKRGRPVKGANVHIAGNVDIGGNILSDVGDFFKDTVPKAAASVARHVMEDPVAAFKFAAPIVSKVAPLLLAAGEGGKVGGKKGGKLKMAGNNGGSLRIAGNSGGSLKMAGNVDIGGDVDIGGNAELQPLIAGARQYLDQIETKIYNMQMHGYDPVTKFNSSAYNNQVLADMERNAKHQQKYMYGEELDVRPRLETRRK